MNEVGCISSVAINIIQVECFIFIEQLQGINRHNACCMIQITQIETAGLKQFDIYLFIIVFSLITFCPPWVPEECSSSSISCHHGSPDACFSRLWQLGWQEPWGSEQEGRADSEVPDRSCPYPSNQQFWPAAGGDEYNIGELFQVA